MSAFGITRTVLITQLTEAVVADGAQTDFAEGKFGPALTAWINETARELALLRDDILAARDVEKPT
jgi:hypothetical protein